MEAQPPSLLLTITNWAQWYLAPLLALGVSAVYFLASPSGVSLSKRIITSAHGLAIAVLYIGAGATAMLGHAHRSLGTPFAWLLIVPVILATVSFLLYDGRKAVHLLQIVNLTCLAWTAFIGGMAITGDWL